MFKIRTVPSSRLFDSMTFGEAFFKDARRCKKSFSSIGRLK